MKVEPLSRAVALDGNRAAMRPDHGLGNREPETKPAEFARDRALALLESVENLLDLSRLDSDPGVDRADRDPCPSLGLSVSTTICPPCGVNFTPFLIRFQKTCWSRAGSPLT